MTDADRTILEIEAQHWRYAGTKEAAVRERLGLSPTAYYQRLNALIDDPEAIAAAPAVLRRVRAVRSRRRGRVHGHGQGPSGDQKPGWVSGARFGL